MSLKIDMKMLDEDDVQEWLVEYENALYRKALLDGLCPLCRLEDCTCEGTD